MHCAQGRVRDSQSGQPFGQEGQRSGLGIDLAGTRTVKEILRVVHAKRLSTEIGRRFSATIENSASASPASTTAPAAVAAAAAAAALAASSYAPAGPETDSSESIGEQAAIGGKPSLSSRGHSHSSTPAGSRHQFDKGGGSKVEAAAELLARVRSQLQQSEERTKGPTSVGRAAGSIAPPR